ncbi:MAG: YbaN family protein [Planctomycetes bacterium]|nr:YbaN family protein [Planctomycetota bacterium]
MRPLYLILAGLFFALAIAGAVLPVLPMTPFLLLTSACLVRSSPRLHAKLRNSKLFGPLLRDWEERRAVRREVKWAAAATMLIAVTATLVFADRSLPVQLATVGLAAIGLTVILRLRTLDESSRPVDVRRVGGVGGPGGLGGPGEAGDVATLDDAGDSLSPRDRLPPTR